MRKITVRRLLPSLAFCLCATGGSLVFTAKIMASLMATDRPSSAQKSLTQEHPVSHVLAQNGGVTSSASFASITSLTTGQNDDGVSINIEANKNIQYTAFKLANPVRLIIDFPQMQQGILTGSIDINQGVVEAVHPIYFNEAEVLRLEVSLNQPASYNIQKPEKNQLLVQLQQAPPASAPEPASKIVRPDSPIATEEGGPPAPQPSQKARVDPGTDPCDSLLAGDKEKISFDFQQADLRNIIRIIGETSGLNIVISPEVGGTISMRLTNVPWNIALATILRNNALGRECFNNILRIANQATLNQEASDRITNKQERITAAQAEKDAAELITKTVRINYADLTALTPNLQPLASPRGQITTDNQTNTVILTDTQARVNNMLNLIETLDLRMGQVMIQARIVEVNKNFLQSMGIQWGGKITRVTPKEFPNTVSLGASTLGGTALTPSGFVVDLPTTSGSAGSLGLSLGSFVGNTSLDIQLSAIETQGKGRILSSPKVTTVDNREASIESGRSIPYQTVSQDGTQTQFAEANISLTVTPHITSSGNIYLRIEARKDAADFSAMVNGVPSITTRRATTEVLVKNGETTVLGGLYESNVNEASDLVPFFGRIPFLGSLFSRANNQDSINELLIFITPTVVENVEPQVTRGP
ncbi:MAG: type IV pilus secretin PilQ [Nitrospinota bacterium]|nr:type IV pilus secretin PilQ [Nitrospinota bacterium]